MFLNMYGYSVLTYECNFFKRCGDRTRTSPIKTEMVAKFRPKQVSLQMACNCFQIFLPFSNPANNSNKRCNLPFFTFAYVHHTGIC